jgi:hypothetical protein
MNQPGNQRRVGFLLRSSSLSVFAILVVTAIVLHWLQWEPITPVLRRGLRLVGYAALVLMLVAYAYWPRQNLLHWRAGKMTGWLSVHIGASYAALALTLVHSLGRAGTPLTFWTMVLFWTVTISGVAGYFGQKVCFRFLSMMLSEEYGMERLPVELASLKEEVKRFKSKTPPQENTPYARLLLDVDRYLQSGWPNWTWLFTTAAYQPVSENLYQQVGKSSGPTEREALKDLWSLIERRRHLDVEYWFHRLAACWLHVHRAAAATLAVLIAAHVISSIAYGGW